MTQPLSFEDVPLPHSEFGRALYRRGRELVAGGLRLDALIWDADEVLWDWVMALSHIGRGLPRAVRMRSLLMHEEFIRIKPGIWELLWGLHHESLARGLDPYMRMWTAGYSWRLWRIAQEFKAFEGLVGPPAAAMAGPQSFVEHPYILTRTDTVHALQSVLDGKGEDRLDDLSRRVITSACDKGRHLAGLKLPALARAIGRDKFAPARVLIDDADRNSRWFAEAGGTALRLRHPAPHIFGGRVRNMVWRRPLTRLARTPGESANALADALWAAHQDGYPQGVRDVLPRGEQRYDNLEFEILVPPDVLEEQWVGPMRSLKGSLQSR